MGNGPYHSYAKEDLRLPVEEFARKASSQMAASSVLDVDPSYGEYIMPAAVAEESAFARSFRSLEGKPDDEDAHWEHIVADNRELRGKYLMEQQDPRHRMGDLLEACLNIYVQQKRQLGPKAAPFFQWLDNIPEWKRIVMIRDLLAGMKLSEAELRWLKQQSERGMSPPSMLSQIHVKPSLVKAFLYGVAYLDRAGRKKYRLSFPGAGRIQIGDRPFDTTHYKTVFSGPGWAIWVLSPQKKIYAGNHIMGQFHHSSFLAGGAVKCGGEMVARAGRLVLLTGKSGHYKPELSNLAYAVKVLREKGVDLNSFKVMLWDRYDHSQPIGVLAKQFLASPYKYDVWGNGKLDPKEWDPRQ